MLYYDIILIKRKKGSDIMNTKRPRRNKPYDSQKQSNHETYYQNERLDDSNDRYNKPTSFSIDNFECRFYKENEKFVNSNKEVILWAGRKHILGLPIGFTYHIITNQRIYTKKGIVVSIVDQCMLRRVKDTQVRRGFIQKLYNLGNIYCVTAESETPHLNMISIKDPSRVNALLSAIVEHAIMRTGRADFYSNTVYDRNF